MFVAQAIFSTKDEASKAILDNKVSHAKQDFEGFEGFIDAQVWKSETGSKLEYAIVSKWNDKKDFQAWISRPSHVEEHKAMHKKSKNDEADKPPFQKTLRQYTVVEF